MKVGWILYGNRDSAGNRIQGWNMHDFLLQQGVDSRIIYCAPTYSKEFKLSRSEVDKLLKERVDILVIKPHKGKNLGYLIQEARKQGKKVAGKSIVAEFLKKKGFSYFRWVWAFREEMEAS